jgi:hypothetical protein
MNGKIAVCLPTMGRLPQFKKFLESYVDTVSRSGEEDLPTYVELIIFQPSDDPDLPAYEEYLNSLPKDYLYRHNIRRIIGDNQGGYAPTNEHISKLCPEYSYYLTMEDDCELLDVGWEVALIAEYAFYSKGIGVLIMQDVSGAVVCEFVSRKWIDTLGFFMLPYLREHAHAAVYTLGQAINRCRTTTTARVRHTVTARNGYTNSSRETMSPQARENYDENERRFHEWQLADFSAAVQKLWGAING